MPVFSEAELWAGQSFWSDQVVGRCVGWRVGVNTAAKGRIGGAARRGVWGNTTAAPAARGPWQATLYWIGGKRSPSWHDVRNVFFKRTNKSILFLLCPTYFFIPFRPHTHSRVSISKLCLPMFSKPYENNNGLIGRGRLTSHKPCTAQDVDLLRLKPNRDPPPPIWIERVKSIIRL